MAQISSSTAPPSAQLLKPSGGGNVDDRTTCRPKRRSMSSVSTPGVPLATSSMYAPMPATFCISKEVRMAAVKFEWRHVRMAAKSANEWLTKMIKTRR
jgi:hypothetical protein